MKILVVLPRFPYPLEKGDKLRAYNQVRELSKNNDIYLFCVSHQKVTPQQVEALKPYCKAIRVVHSPRLVNCKNVLRNYLCTKSLQIGYWDSRRARRRYKAFEAQVQPDVIYNQMVRTMTLVSRSRYPKVMDFQDALSMNTERRMEQSRGLWHHILHYEFKMLRSTEYNSFKIFDALTIISEPDSEAIPHKKNGDIHVVPNGVDFDHFKPQDKKKAYDVVFCGNMRYEPNVKAARFLAEKVMPLVWKVQPQATLLLAGAYPKRDVARLASGRVAVTGWVDDIRDSYASARIFAAPMLTGSGLQNKLLEAMAMGMPCVTTTIANRALGAEPGSEVLVGDTATEFADHIIDLIQSQEERDTLAANGSAYVRGKFSWEASCAKLEEILRQACGAKL